MPKHLLLFTAFMALMVAVFYYPIPNPELWDADSRHIAQPDYSIPGISPKPDKITNWSEQLEKYYNRQSRIETLSSIQ